MPDRPEAPRRPVDPRLAVARTLVRHERGTLLLLMTLMGLILLAETIYLTLLWSRTQLYSTPDIYREESVDIHWGARHG